MTAMEDGDEIFATTFEPEPLLRPPEENQSGGRRTGLTPPFRRIRSPSPRRSAAHAHW